MLPQILTEHVIGVVPEHSLVRRGGAMKDRRGDRRSEDLQAIEKLGEAWVAAVNASDVNGIVALVTDDVIFLPPNMMAVRGKKSVISMYQSFFSEYRVRHRGATEEIQVAGDWAFAWGTDYLTLIPVLGGPSIKVSGRVMSIMRRQPDGSWKFARAINNMS